MIKLVYHAKYHYFNKLIYRRAKSHPCFSTQVLLCKGAKHIKHFSNAYKLEQPFGKVSFWQLLLENSSIEFLLSEISFNLKNSSSIKI